MFAAASVLAAGGLRVGRRGATLPAIGALPADADAAARSTAPSSCERQAPSTVAPSRARNTALCCLERELKRSTLPTSTDQCRRRVYHQKMHGDGQCFRRLARVAIRDSAAAAKRLVHGL
jgi:hypothetical protein